MRRAYSASQRTTLPMPAATVWSSSTSPIGRVACAGARTLDGDRDAGVVVEQVGAETAQRGVERDAGGSSNSSTGPPNWTATIPFAASVSQAFRGERAQGRPSG